MPDPLKLKRDKDRILAAIRIRGPTLPVQIAKSLGISPLFASAFLAELHAERKLKMSSMRVGSSPLYFLPGQEHLLENFTQHVGGREQEALSLLKEKKVLEDQQLPPVTRVSLRSLKDFASPIRIRVKEEVKLFWKYFTLPDSEVKTEVQKILNPETERQSLEQKKPEPMPKPEPIPKQQPQKIEIPKQPITQKPKPQKTEPTITEPEKQIPKPQKPKKKPAPNHEFPKNIKDYLIAKDIELLESISEKKKEFISKIRTDTLFGKQSYLLIAKDKKKITENDLNIALQKSRSQKMPALILSPGELNKKALAHLKEWQNLIKFEKVVF